MKMCLKTTNKKQGRVENECFALMPSGMQESGLERKDQRPSSPESQDKGLFRKQQGSE